MARVNIYIARFLIYEANILVVMYIIKCQGKPDQVKSVSFQPAYVVSVSVEFRSKERLRNDEEKDFRFCPPSSLTRIFFRAVFHSRSSLRKRLLRRLVLMPPLGFRPEGEILRRHSSNSRVY